MNNIDDLLGLEDDGRPLNRRAKKARTSRGKLHDLMTVKFPHLVDKQSGVCNLHRIAELRGMSFQGVYKWFKKHDANQLPYAQALWLIELSERYAKKLRKDDPDAAARYQPMTFEEVQPFITPT